MAHENARKRNPHGILKSEISNICWEIRNRANWFKDEDGEWILTVDKFDDTVIRVIHYGLESHFHLQEDGPSKMRWRILPKCGYYAYKGQEPLGEETMDPDRRRVWRGFTRTDAVESARAAFGDDFRLYSFGDIDQLNSYTEVRP